MSYVRFIHCASILKSVNVYSGVIYNNDNLELKAINLEYKDATAYIPLESCPNNIVITSFNGETTIYSDIFMFHNSKYTILITDRGLENYEDNAPKIEGNAYVRYINTTSSSGDRLKIMCEKACTEIYNIGSLYWKISYLDENMIFNVKDYICMTNVFAGYVITVIFMGKDQLVAYRDNYSNDNYKLLPYMGIWYQIAYIPKEVPYCNYHSVAMYTLLEDRVKVTNICYNTDGSVYNHIIGSAVPGDGGLIVSFPVVDSSPSYTNYIIHYTDYTSYSMVGSPDRKSLFILSRKKAMKCHIYNKMKEEASRLGYDITCLKLD